jgi:uncharacterized protein YjiK
VHVFAPDLGSVVARVDLTVPKTDPFFDDWEYDENSRGEGLVLLGRNHFLVVKEKQPAALVEFGPAGDAPIGFSSETMRKAGDPFTLPAGKRSAFVPLKVWRLGANTTRILPDVSEAAVGEDGYLYLLGDQSRTVARLEKDLRPDEAKAKIEAWWRLPKDVEKPEGLAFLPGGRTAVATDVDDDSARNLFVFDALK